MFCEHTILKRGEKRPVPILPDINCVKEAKKNDVLKLLDEMGVLQPVCDFNENALVNDGDRVTVQDNENSSDKD